jgi:hypothetical protein
MNENVNRGNPPVKMKQIVWKIKVGVFSPVLIEQPGKETETKIWEIKVILN